MYGNKPFTGFPELDRILKEDNLVEFYSLDQELLRLFYHRVIAISSPIMVVIVSERGGLDPVLVRRFQRTFGTEGEVRLRRAFKVEDVEPTLKSMGDTELIVIDPYHHRKPREYSKIVGALREKRGRKFVFSYMDREKEGSTFGLHSAQSVIKLERSHSGFRAIIVKSVLIDNIEIPFGLWSIYGRTEEGLMKWII
ncbi:hypothetical protein [Metallosphaera hakonensis]|uniref:Uncharacterized protein n=1 Tax=Metallosphaera hakonensis JCM 8857 = DSM 7519 TaxID=1293036 RepID=A0A2U9IW75_9CREN|nr:hypothetical protein [Metallosphaera hakonensis]AWS00214.1 hypothetical protein DFR87_11545 [Metallosphaera hakonensis JCM 8857 = DSM 7519]